jgi:hypothetical protein
VYVCSGAVGVRITVASAKKMFPSMIDPVRADLSENVSFVTEAGSIISLNCTVIAVLMLLLIDWLTGLVDITVGGT